MATGLVILGFSIAVAVTILEPQNFRILRLLLFLPAYAGFLSILEGVMSFCIFHASRGTYDFSEKLGMPWGESATRQQVGSEDWKQKDLRKVRVMRLEALVATVLFAVVLVII